VAFRNQAAGCSLGFNVANPDQTFAGLTSKGVQFAVPRKVQDGEGIKLAVCVDPDGPSYLLRRIAAEMTSSQAPGETASSGIPSLQPELRRNRRRY